MFPVLVILSWSFFTTVQAESNRIERLVMPGPLVQGHARYENECERCHKPFSKVKQSRLCRDCHDKVDADIRDKRGFHGRNAQARGTECKHCHTDHKGREQDIVLLDEASFDHGQTDHRLQGAHRSLKCEACHKTGKKFRDTPGKCFDCHKTDEPHKGRLGKKCADCHDEKSWKRTRFDHDKTHFPLKNRHSKVACAACHPGERYKKLPSDCVGCHRINDIHGGRYGGKCQDCHRDTGWKKLKFDHDRDTKFRLLGRHARVLCDSCHKGIIKQEKLKKDCYTCHKKDDEHRGINGHDCRKCHNEQGWAKTRFDHDRDTKYPLRHRHRQVACESCHKDPVYKDRLDMRCISCHRNNDEHQGHFGRKCRQCHSTRGWGKIDFDHDKDTHFKLMGKHKKVDCRACHKGTLGQEKLGHDCYSCHRGDDIHKGAQGRNCTRCHNNEDWGGKVVFDHDLTRFPLIGLHATTACEECHIADTFKDTRRECHACHQADDEHKGKLGRDCDLCHTPNDWALWKFDHDKQTKYPLSGAHEGLDCLACHQEVVKDRIELPKRCYACHREDDVHRGGFGRNCDQCHSTDRFDNVDIVR